MIDGLLPQDSVIPPVAHALQVFRILKQANYPGIYRRVSITRDLVNDLVALSAHIDRVGAVAEAVAGDEGIDWDAISGVTPMHPGILEEAFCQLAGRQLGATVFFDEQLVAGVYDAIAEVQYRFFLERLLESRPLSAMEYHDRANARCETGDHPGAVSDYSSAIEHDPSEPRYHISRARCLLEHHGDPLSAEVDIRAAMDLADPAEDPSVLDVLVLRARVMLAQGKTVQAVRSLMDFARDAGAAVACAEWGGDGRGVLESGASVEAAALLDCIEEAVEILQALPDDEDVKMLDRLLGGLAERL